MYKIKHFAIKVVTIIIDSDVYVTLLVLMIIFIWLEQHNFYDSIVFIDLICLCQLMMCFLVDCIATHYYHNIVCTVLLCSFVFYFYDCIPYMFGLKSMNWNWNWNQQRFLYPPQKKKNPAFGEENKITIISPQKNMCYLFFSLQMQTFPLPWGHPPPPPRRRVCSHVMTIWQGSPKSCLLSSSL